MFWNFWNKKNKAEEVDQSVTIDDISELEVEQKFDGEFEDIFSSMPREHHYTLGHIAFRQYCTSNTEHFFTSMVSEDESKDLIQGLWLRVCEECGSPETTDVDIDELDLLTFSMNGLPTVLICMPETKAVAEAIFVLVVLTNIEDLSFRYFTLEAGESDDGRDSTVFCEWADEAHINMGEGCEPSTNAFMNLVKEKLALN